jgi:hypothetical protein
MQPSRIEQAQALKACLVQLAGEASENGFVFCTLHLRVAILELDDLLDTEKLRARLLAKGTSAAADGPPEGTATMP